MLTTGIRSVNLKKENPVTEQAISIAVDEAEMARLIGMSVHFLRKDRVTKRLLPFYKIGDAVRYDPSRVRLALVRMEEGGARKTTQSTIRAGLDAQLR
jgi:hypothetical protein